MLINKMRVKKRTKSDFISCLTFHFIGMVLILFSYMGEWFGSLTANGFEFSGNLDSIMGRSYQASL